MTIQCVKVSALSRQNKGTSETSSPISRNRWIAPPRKRVRLPINIWYTEEISNNCFLQSPSFWRRHLKIFRDYSIPSRSLYPIIPLSQRARRPARILYAQILQYKAMHYPDNIFIFWILISFICFSFYQHIHFPRHKRLWLISCSLPG